MNPIEFVGFTAGAFVAISLLPQVLKSWKTKSTHDIAFSWTLINFVGQILWLCYGIGIGSASLIVMSGITLLMTIVLIALKIRYG